MREHRGCSDGDPNCDDFVKTGNWKDVLIRLVEFETVWDMVQHIENLAATITYTILEDAPARRVGSSSACA